MTLRRLLVGTGLLTLTGALALLPACEDEQQVVFVPAGGSDAGGSGGASGGGQAGSQAGSGGSTGGASGGGVVDVNGQIVDSCEDNCGIEADKNDECACDEECADWGDCCDDYVEYCTEGTTEPDPNYEFPVPLEELSGLSYGDCRGWASGSINYCDTNDCKGLGSGNSSYCDGPDCKGITSGDQSKCASNLCKALADNDQSLCSTADCKGLVNGVKSQCKSSQCKAVVGKSGSSCPSD